MMGTRFGSGKPNLPYVITSDARIARDRPSRALPRMNSSWELPKWYTGTGWQPCSTATRMKPFRLSSLMRSLCSSSMYISATPPAMQAQLPLAHTMRQHTAARPSKHKARHVQLEQPLEVLLRCRAAAEPAHHVAVDRHTQQAAGHHAVHLHAGEQHVHTRASNKGSQREHAVWELADDVVWLRLRRLDFEDEGEVEVLAPRLEHPQIQKPLPVWLHRPKRTREQQDHARPHSRGPQIEGDAENHLCESTGHMRNGHMEGRPTPATSTSQAHHVPAAASATQQTEGVTEQRRGVPECPGPLHQ